MNTVLNSFPAKATYIRTKIPQKYCLQRRGVPPAEDAYCEYCHKQYAKIGYLREHQKICRVKQVISNHLQKETLVEETKMHYESQIECLTKQLENKTDHLKTTEKRLSEMTSMVKESIKSLGGNQSSEPSNVTERMKALLDQPMGPSLAHLSTITLGDVTVNSRRPDHYVNATELCQAGDKNFGDWYRSDDTKQILTVLSSDLDIPIPLLVESKRGDVIQLQQGTWVHPDLAIQLAQWISPTFGIRVSSWVRAMCTPESVAMDLKLFKMCQSRVQQLEEVCLSKTRRVEYKEHNVIYLVTTEDHLKRRTYIVGKARDLTSRLSTYNKTCEHTVEYYRACPTEDDMATAEVMILSRLRNYREKSNRDRFILPDDQDVSFFISVIDECIDFIGKKEPI